MLAIPLAFAHTRRPSLSIKIAIASYLESKHVQRIASLSSEITVMYEPSLLAPPRYQADHTGSPTFRRSQEQEKRFHSMLSEAEIHYDFDRGLLPILPSIAPRLSWIQATSSGIGPLLNSSGISRTKIIVTNAAGIHAGPLAEHTLLSLLYFVKNVPKRLREQRDHKWERYSGRELRGMTIVVIGLGAVGQEIARVCHAVGMYVIGVRRTVIDNPSTYNVDEATTPDRLHDVLPRANALVLICPHTPETEGMIGDDELALLPEGAVLINIGRGVLVREEALITSLASGHLGGAALDVAMVEPMAINNPLWDMSNVFITPHSASTVESENARLTDLFCENLRRYLANEPLLNVVNY